jgi:hypothetical protein
VKESLSIFDFKTSSHLSDQTEVELPEKSCQDVSEMIRFIHPGFGDDLEGGVDSAFRLLPIADEYQIQKLKDKCEDVLKSNICTLQGWSKFQFRSTSTVVFMRLHNFF